MECVCDSKGGSLVVRLYTSVCVCVCVCVCVRKRKREGEREGVSERESE